MVDDSVDVEKLKFDFIKNKSTDLSGNEVNVSNQVYCMEANEEGATSTIIHVESLPFPGDKTNMVAIMDYHIRRMCAFVAKT